MKIAVIIPFRDRGIDPRRAANLEVVQAWWYAHGFDPKVVSDGLEGDAQFNRHRAYNRAASGNEDADVFVFTEADMLIHPDQIHLAARQAQMQLGLIVPFTEYRYLSDEMTATVRDRYHDWEPEWIATSIQEGWPFNLYPESVMRNGRSIGAINVVSRDTLDLTGGFTEATSGNWYDDNIIEEAFAFLAAPTRWVSGPAVHLYHLPGHKGAHLTARDKQATLHNKMRLQRMREDIRAGRREPVYNFMKYRKP